VPGNAGNFTEGIRCHVTDEFEIAARAEKAFGTTQEQGGRMAGLQAFKECADFENLTTCVFPGLQAATTTRSATP
jgi:hypothetical protein